METLFPVFIASLIGSPHCAVMCGGFAAACSTTTSRNSVFYHCGRAISYTFLGLLAGYAGKTLNSQFSFTGFTNVTALIIAIILIYWGLRQLVAPGYLSASASPPSFLTSVLSKIYKNAGAASGSAFLLGIASAFLPCGWLYSYVGIAASSGDAFRGALIMFIFWLGTVPILATITSFSKIVTQSLGKHASKITAFLFIFAGIASLSIHLGLINIPMHNHSHHSEHTMTTKPDTTSQDHKHDHSHHMHH